jgi:hypothetical protein
MRVNMTDTQPATSRFGPGREFLLSSPLIFLKKFKNFADLFFFAPQRADSTRILITRIRVE